MPPPPTSAASNQVLSAEGKFLHVLCRILVRRIRKTQPDSGHPSLFVELWLMVFLCRAHRLEKFASLNLVACERPTIAPSPCRVYWRSASPLQGRCQQHERNFLPLALHRVRTSRCGQGLPFQKETAHALQADAHGKSRAA